MTVGVFANENREDLRCQPHRHLYTTAWRKNRRSLPPDKESDKSIRVKSLESLGPFKRYQGLHRLSAGYVCPHALGEQGVFNGHSSEAKKLRKDIRRRLNPEKFRGVRMVSLTRSMSARVELEKGIKDHQKMNYLLKGQISRRT